MHNIAIYNFAIQV